MEMVRVGTARQTAWDYESDLTENMSMRVPNSLRKGRDCADNVRSRSLSPIAVKKKEHTSIPLLLPNFNIFGYLACSNDKIEDVLGIIGIGKTELKKNNTLFFSLESLLDYTIN